MRGGKAAHVSGFVEGLRLDHEDHAKPCEIDPSAALSIIRISRGRVVVNGVRDRHQHGQRPGEPAIDIDRALDSNDCVRHSDT